MKLQHLSAIALAVSTALTLTACGSEAETAYGLANSSNPLVQPSNTGNSNTSNADAADAVNNTSAGTNTNTNNTTSPQGDSGEFTTTTPFSYTIIPTAGDEYRKEMPKYYSAAKARDSLHNEVAKAYNQVDADGKSRFQTTEGYRATINGNTYYSDDFIPITTLGNGYHSLDMNETMVTHIDGVRYTGERASRVKLYQQDHSLVLGRQTLSGQMSDGTTPKTLVETDLRIDNLKGKPTDPKEFANFLADRAYFTYKGQAFSKEGVGNLEYSVDFVDASGSGKITGLSDKGTINLNQANFVTLKHTNPDDGFIDLSTGEAVPNVINSIGISGKAHFANGAKDGTYTLGFFGPEAVEIAGFVIENNTNTVGFGGKKQ